MLARVIPLRHGRLLVVPQVQLEALILHHRRVDGLAQELPTDSLKYPARHDASLGDNIGGPSRQGASGL